MTAGQVQLPGLPAPGIDSAANLIGVRQRYRPWQGRCPAVFILKTCVCKSLPVPSPRCRRRSHGASDYLPNSGSQWSRNVIRGTSFPPSFFDR
jgi:hypothetical protein